MLQIGKSYVLYGKIGNMKRFKPVCDNKFVINLIHAEIIIPKSNLDLDIMQKELLYLNTQGVFEYREILF